MSGQITISIWLFLILLAVAIWAVLDRVLIPSTRWFLRRRINRVIDEISIRLLRLSKPFSARPMSASVRVRSSRPKLLPTPKKSFRHLMPIYISDLATGWQKKSPAYYTACESGWRRTKS